MSNGWDGSDPSQFNEPGIDYELSTRWLANADVTITGVRVWAGSSSSVPGRSARLWSTSGVELAVVALDASLPAGWTTYDLDEPYELTAGNSVDVSYGTVQFYGATAGGFPNASADGLVSATGGRFNDTAGAFPTNLTTSFYGVDIVYTEGTGGNAAPEVTALAVVADGLDVDATATISDENPSTVTIRWDWGDGDSNLTGAGVVVASHTYDAPGLYAVMAIATDSGGLRGQRATPVVVRDDTGLFDLDAAVEELATRLDTIPGLRVHRYGPDAKRINPPAVIVALPADPIVYHETYQQGGPAASTTIPIVVVVGKVHSRSAYQALAQYLAAGGSRSIRATVESGVFTAFDGVTVTEGVTDEYTFAGDAYLVAIFSTVIMK